MQHLLALISMHACTIKKEYLWMKSACEHIPENCFKHLIVVHRSSNSYNRTCKFLNYLIHEKYIQFPFLHAVLCSVLSMI